MNVLGRRRDCPIGRKRDGHRFLEKARSDLHRLPEEGQYNNRALLCRKIGSIRRRIAEKTASLGDEKCVVSQWQHTGSHSSFATAKLVELGYELLLHPSYSLGLAPCDVFLFPNLKKPLVGQKYEPN
ncbi:hypothetical protein PYW07_012450 [Mythimna separata]|uniref:Histone-lysine N-methyltransferase SETMAR n=1 Tax=Mythimna separata TaxID=271217 RepID=A0AAD7YNF6_MYTSE|nr:hypothetical protein PYW07_012450 [Mythimna separata]